MSAHSHPEEAPPMGTARWSSQVKATVRSFLGYLQIRSQLFALECREAAHFGGRQLVVCLLGGALLLVGYALLIVSAIALIASALHVLWVWPALVFALLHLAGGSLLWWFAQTRLKRPLFEATLSELEKDQEWITRNLPSHPERRN